MNSYVVRFDELASDHLSLAGGKGASLARMIQAGYPVPNGFVILPGAFDGNGLLADAWVVVSESLNGLRRDNPDLAFAVRSSARSEDSSEASFAGEFESVLNVCTDDDIYQAIETVYRSRYNERVQAYSQMRGMENRHEIAVVIQELVIARSSGVMFTANPVTGNRDQVMISAAWGLGEAVVQGVVTTDTLLVDRNAGAVIQHEIADKQVMTIRLESGTEERQTPADLRHQAVLSDEQAIELAWLGTQVEALFGLPVDIEWVFDGETFSIVQARPITALPNLDIELPIEWKLPEGMYSAMRNNIVELMADPLTPLFRTLGLDAVNTSMHNTLKAFFGGAKLMPDELIFTVNQYAYYNGSVKPGQVIGLLLRSVGIVRRMFTGAVERWTEKGRLDYIRLVETWEANDWQALSTGELIETARMLTIAAVDAYMSLVSGVIPAAWITEALFTSVHRIVRRKDDPTAPTFLLGFDSLPIKGEKALYDLAQWAKGDAALSTYLTHTQAAQLAAHLELDHAPDGVDGTTWQEWQQRIKGHLEAYGYTIYNLDFSNPVPTDDPAPLLETLKLFLSGKGVNPHERQQVAIARREEAIRQLEGRLHGLRLKLFRKRLAVAQRFAPLREDGLAEVGLSYPLLRRMLREVGRRFAERGIISETDHIYWLTQDEVMQMAPLADRGEAIDDLAETVKRRQADWRAARRISPPLMLPQMIVFGVDLAELKSGKVKGDANTLKGVAASPGVVTAPARVVHGPEDFVRMQTGEILVAALTTPAWTPLFARAAAVVTDIGGPLSHGSIVAREYGIPAVLGTGIATARIRTGQIITVDGAKGTITV